MNKLELVTAEFSEAKLVLDSFISDPENFNQIILASELMVESLSKGGKIISCGNGGSFCDALHFAEELSGKFRENRRGIAAISISDGSYLTCVGNDFGFDYVFLRFVESIEKPSDVLLDTSTSGNSENVINSAKEANQKGMCVVALTGKDGGVLKGLADVCINVQHAGYADRIQEVHIKIIHTLILLIEKALS